MLALSQQGEPEALVSGRVASVLRTTDYTARALVAMKSLASSSCSVMCGRPSQQTRKREIACVRNRLFSLARIASKESQRATKVTSGDSICRKLRQLSRDIRLAVVPARQVKTEYPGNPAPYRGERGVAKRGQAGRPPEFRATKKGVLFFPKGHPNNQSLPSNSTQWCD